MTGHGVIFFVNTSLLIPYRTASSGVDSTLDNTYDTLGYLHSVFFGRRNSIRLPEKLLRRDFVLGHSRRLVGNYERALARSSSHFCFSLSLSFQITG